MHRVRSIVLIPAALAVLLAWPAAGSAAAPGPGAVQRGLEDLVAAQGGPPGAIATLYRDGR